MSENMEQYVYFLIFFLELKQKIPSVGSKSEDKFHQGCQMTIWASKGLQTWIFPLRCLKQ